MEQKTETQAENKNFYLTQTPIKKLLLKFAIPCVLGMLVSALYNIVDQIFIGAKLGTAGIYATTVVYPVTIIALAIAMMIGEGCSSLFSISLGSNDEKTSRKCVGNALISVVISGIVLTVLGFALKDQILHLCGVTEECYNYANLYYIIIISGFVFYMFAQTASSIIRADGSPRYSMLATLVGAVINIILDPILIFACNMGIVGAAVATIIGQVVSAIVCLVYFRKTKLIKLKKDSFKLSGKTIGSVCKLGLSSFITQFAIAVITIVANDVIRAIAGRSGYDASGPGGVLGVVFKVFGIVMAFCNGIALGGLPIIGYNYGAKEHKRVFEAYKYIVIANIVIGLISTILFEVCPQIFASLFGIEASLVAYSNMSFRIYLGGILLCCIQKASCIFLQSINKPYKAMILSLMRDIVFLVPGVCLFGFLGDVEIMLWAGILADTLSFLITMAVVLVECKKLKHSQIKQAAYVAPITASNNLVITIGREFGSGGKYIGQELARRLNINCYDNELVSKVAQNFNIDLETLQSVDEKQKSSFWYGFATNYVFSNDQSKVLPVSPEDSLFLKQSKIIEDLYNSESCVLIGRCADYILKDKPNVIKIFVYSSDMQFKILRKVKFENYLEDEAKTKIIKTDKERADYYKHFTSQTWGDKYNYDICIDTSKLGIEKSVDLIEDYIKAFKTSK